MKIKILDNETILKIAAGEVIERPASVVRELVDNAIDAGAGNISVEIWDGGKERIVISDDGQGMSAEELALAVERHSTSKIANGLDLFAISTLGFRGEALASIGAVSSMTITTRTMADVGGSRLTVRGGEKMEVQPASSPVGTKICVEALFFNTPARKKFLRAQAAEFSAIAESVHQQILAWPSIRFKLAHNGKPILSSPGSGSLMEAVASLAGTEIAENLLECMLSMDGYSVTGFIAKPEFHRSNRGLQNFSVNHRPVNVRLMGSAVEKAFHTLLPVNRYPIAFLDLQVPYENVDVNVHPAKREVKFADANTVFRVVYHACLQALTAVTGGAPAQPQWNQDAQVLPDSLAMPGVSRAPVYTAPSQPFAEVREATQLRLDIGPNPESEHQILGQIFSSFLIVATTSELRLIDQHAAQERILYEDYLHILKAGQRPSQAVLPVETPLSGRMRIFVEAHHPRLAELGFKIELTETGMTVKEVPVLFKKILSAQDILEILEKIQATEGSVYDLSDYSQAALMLLACKGAVKANYRLSSSEARQLLIDLDRCDNSRTCPHGRPIWVAFDRVNLEKMFARR